MPNEKSLPKLGGFDLRETGKYAWVDAFRASLCSNSQEIAVLLKRFEELDLTA
tara:strand:- start:7031 stop:7189 length:159 start_codon:yes stop_codon:yes gene_type:complete